MSRLHELGAAVSPDVIEDAIEIGELLASLKVPHALIGGLAVGLNGFPRATPEALILMKLLANRPQDRADIVRLIDADLEGREVAAYLAEHAPDLLNRFAELVDPSTTA